MAEPFDLSGIDDSPGRPGYTPTRMESMEAVQKALAENSKKDSDPHLQHATPLEDDAAGFRPVRRPPTAMLCIFDDGSDDGEWIRLRVNRLIIGRTEGDLLIPHDERISSQHAELSRKIEDGHSSWYLTDMRSTNGTYVARKQHPLKHGQELLIGGCRWRFDLPVPQNEVTEISSSAMTRGIDAVPSVKLFPTLTEVTPHGPGRRFVLDQSENWLGRDPKLCRLSVPDDPMLSPRHASFARNEAGGWEVRDAGSRNGVWVRVDRVQIRGTCRFQLGEQRFYLRVQSP